jgi:hypothetical protein
MVKKTVKSKNFNIISPIDQLKFDFFYNFEKSNFQSILKNNNLNVNHPNLSSALNLNKKILSKNS